MKRITKFNKKTVMIYIAVFIAIIALIIFLWQSKNKSEYFDENENIVEINTTQLPTLNTPINTITPVISKAPANTVAAGTPVNTHSEKENIPIRTEKPVVKNPTPPPEITKTNTETAVFDQETTNKINEINSYSMRIETFDRQKFIDVCMHIAREETFDTQLLDIFQDGKLYMHYISHTDNVVARDIGMSYWHDYINPSGALDGFKYTVAFRKGDKWELHCITIRMA
jgi:hypothetical protein